MGKTPKKDDDKAPKCNRCRNHGVTALLKGHKRNCPHKNCNCAQGCGLITRRREIMAHQGQLRRREEEVLQTTKQIDDQSGLPRGSTDNATLPPDLPLPYSSLPLMTSTPGGGTFNQYPPSTTVRPPAVYNTQQQQWGNNETPSYRRLLSSHPPPFPSSLPTTFPPTPPPTSHLQPLSSSLSTPFYPPLTPSTFLDI